MALKHLDIVSTEYPTFLNANRFLSSLASLFDCFIAILNITDFSLIAKMSFQVMFMLFKLSVKSLNISRVTMALFFMPKFRTIEVILATMLGTLRTKSTNYICFLNLLKPIMLIFLIFATVHLIVIVLS